MMLGWSLTFALLAVLANFAMRALRGRSVV